MGEERRIKVVFDFDGTLANSVPAFAKAIKETLREFGLEVNERELIPLVGYPKETIFSKFLPTPLVPKAIEVFNKIVKKYVLRQSELYEDAKEVLPKLKEKGAIVGIYTASPAEWVLKILGPYSKYVDYLDAGKKEKSLFLEKFRPDLYVGDHIVDIQLAEKFNVPFVLIERDHNKWIDYEPKIKNLNEIFDYLGI